MGCVWGGRINVIQRRFIAALLVDLHKFKKGRIVEAYEILEAGANEMADRAKTYDAPEGERSMKKTVEMFNALTGANISEAQGWKFMVCLKLVRSEQGAHRDDNFIDGAAYFGLAGETAAKDAGRDSA